jgi:hypothetical protein
MTVNTKMKLGVAISELGKKMMLKVEDRDNLRCDILEVNTFFFLFWTPLTQECPVK